MMMPDHIGDFKVGDKVKIKEGNVVFWHVKPKDYPDGFTCPKGMEGTHPPSQSFPGTCLVDILRPCIHGQVLW